MSPGQESVDKYLRATASAVVDALGPLVRADERAALRAKVEALPGALATPPPDRMVLLSDVLALLDEAP